MDKKLIAEMVKEMKLKYNYFSSEHPNKELKGRLFKFLNNNQVQFLRDRTVKTIKPDDLERGGKKLYNPADMH